MGKNKRIIAGLPAIIQAGVSIGLVCLMLSFTFEKTVLADISHSVIVEKNLFHPSREKWLIEDHKPAPPKQLPKVDKEKLSKIVLYGTVLSDGEDYAVVRMGKKRRGKHRENIYMEGDYIGGYLLMEVDEDKIVLKNEETDEDYNIFIFEGNKDRKPVKTAIKTEAWERNRRKAGKKKKIKKDERGRRIRTGKATSKKRLERNIKKHLRILKRKDSKAVKTQFQRDYRKLKRLMPYMSDKERREVLSSKKQFDKIQRAN